MAAFGLTESEFLERYRGVLESASSSTVERLKGLLALPLEAGVSFAQVEIFLGEYGAAPEIYMYFRGRNNKVDRSDPSLFPGRSLALSLELNQLSEFDEKYFDARSFPGSNLAGNALKAWFAECWRQAGGGTYRVPVTLAVHDGFGDGKVVILCKGANP